MPKGQKDILSESFDIDQLKASVKKSVELEEPIHKLQISISEGLYLIALGDEEGQLLKKSEKVIDYGLIAGGILELYLIGSIRIEKEIIKISSTNQTGNIFLDSILINLTESGIIEELLRLKIISINYISIWKNSQLPEESLKEKKIPCYGFR